MKVLVLDHDGVMCLSTEWGGRMKKIKKWKLENPEYLKNRDHRRWVMEKNSKPKWIDAKEIKNIYDKAVELSLSTGVKYVVDHIYPLEHPLMCGLTVPWNLQVITHKKNIKKGKSIPKEGTIGSQ